MLGVMRAQLVSPCVKHPDGDLTTFDVVLRRHRKRPSLEPSGQSAGSFFFFFWTAELQLAGVNERQEVRSQDFTVGHLDLVGTAWRTSKTRHV